MMKKLLSLMLCIAMLLTLTACGGTGEETTPPTTTVPPTTTEPAPDPVEIFNAAADQINANDSMLVNLTIDKEMTVGSDTYLESEVLTLSLKDLGSDSFIASSSSEITWGEDYYATTSDVYSGGTLYGAVDKYAYSTAMTAEEYLARFAPAVLLTPALYETVEFTDEATISFTGASEAESWLAEEGLELLDASGTAIVDAGGVLTNCTYQATYLQGGVQVKLTVTTRAVNASAQVDVPTDTSMFAPVENPGAALAYERAIGMALQARDVTSSSTESIVIQAGAVSMTQQSTMNSFGADKDLMAQFNTDIALTDLSTGSPLYALTQQESFRDGTYTLSTDGSAPQSDPTVDAELMRSICQAFIPNMIMYLDDLENLTLTDLGAAYLLEYNMKADVARQLPATLCGSIYEDPNLLDDLASDYRTETACGYIGIDKVTGMPLSLGQEFVGIHTIEGTECPITYNHSQTVSFGTGEAYKTITGEALPVEAPETQAAPLLYHVTGADGQELWLFGTIHVGDARTAYLPQQLQDAFASSDALAVEFDTDAFLDQMESDPELAALILQTCLYTDGTTVSDHLEDDALVDQAMQVLKSTGNYNSALLLMRPIILSQTIQNDYLRLSRTLTSELGADSQLLSMAREQNKEILNVESGEAQLQMLAGFSDALQELLLRDALELGADDYVTEVRELYELWCQGDEAALQSVIRAETDGLTEEELVLYQEYNDALSTQRNQAMLEVAEGYLASGDTVFYAVGLAHLLAEDGLVDALRNAGYTVELVTYE